MRQFYSDLFLPIYLHMFEVKWGEIQQIFRNTRI